MVNPLVSIIMGSDSDLQVMQEAGKVLKEFNVPFEITIVSAIARLNGYMNFLNERINEEFRL